MRGAIPPLPRYILMAWCLVKHRDNLLTLVIHEYPSVAWFYAMWMAVQPRYQLLHCFQFMG